MAFNFRLAAVLAVSAFSLSAEAHAASTNPFFSASTLPYQAPRFDQITDSDYAPAFERGMAEHLREIKAIANNRAAPTFDNTIAAMERAGQTLNRVQMTFYGVYQANTNDTLDKVQSQEAPRLTAHEDEVYLNAKLFARVKSLYDRREKLTLTPEQAQLLDIYYQQFVHAGAQLSATDKTKLRAINTRLSNLETQYEQKLIASAKNGALIVDSKKALDGLDDNTIASAAKAAQERGLTGKWVIPLQNTTQQPALTSLTDRETRQALFEQSWTRAEKGDENDTRATISELAELRAQKAALFGYPNFAAYTLYDQMAKTPEAAENFMQQLVPATVAEQNREAEVLQKAIRKDGGKFDLKPWDWEHYSDQVRRAKYNLDQDEIKPYFELKTVLTDGVFFAANQLYGITFQQRTDIPVYQPDVMVFEVHDKDGSPLGLMYFDYFKRDNKSGGAWMSNFVGQSKLLGTKPVIYNVANFTKAAPGQPQLITSDDVTTMFHEFGHALHGLFADQTYPSLSGTSVARDFVEFPSQFNENWALDPKVLSHYARHYKTGAPMPKALVEKIRKAAHFNQGYALGEIVAASELDMKWHSLPATAPRQDVDKFESDALNSTGLDVAAVPPRYRSSYFLHIWSNGYSAGYYAYLWTEMLDQDVFSWFQEHGGLTRENGQRFRDMILSKGHTMDYGPMFRAFYGRDPDITPMLVHRGLVSEQGK
ncbi:M3 family metallopeptidase [Gluconobacter sphaericus]|uniref:Dipeptidyl carboxypeptidase n=1 Tax=Gluconobacter sphaericus NBRC 12467 TaxID=1307951 RepID=A0AA37WCT0_9PROT|nr:M3 family metallopeptidase [Gluconobacter sphaericus]MBF0886781.1 M3 family metallopeptidase [Gluconobacter sphaericus]GBR51679.1 peptidyl-dipeptidase DCP [Gluconobacter sphaericus NBRC 12467]GEB43546.1 dipeptidyl carboxypeptidase II [Gluconobacter sphaericus NBRC 12467]GLQ86256.1 dipeptidyl carboxypeptidase II [Gluconobacter sphaericus NBRC 12467]